MTSIKIPAPTPDTKPSPDSGQTQVQRLVKAILTQRVMLLAILVVLVVVIMSALDAAGFLAGSYNSDYLSSSLINAVPLVMLGLAQLVVIVSGRGGIDLSVGAIVSLVGMVFGFFYGVWGLPLLASVIGAIAVGAVLGAVNGVMVAYLGFPPLIATLATYYVFRSLAIVINNQQPISTKPIQDLYSLSNSVEIPLIGQYLPNVPLGVVLFLLPTVVVVWFLLNRAPYGRRLFAIGTNDIAALWSGVNVAASRAIAYTVSGAISGLVAVVTVSQFASARPDAGDSGSGMALPSITIAVLAGVAITGGIGRVSGVVVATVLIIWLNAGILLLFVGNVGSQLQSLALGVILVFAALLNGYTNRRYRVMG
ncbi:ABC transporter permease [Cryobacterium glaciale]|uniref:ABC transporter permease n=1 Tax=Cryobacterium glaciale TaxID=1259145 RepID=A0A4R8V494_9MICO|nr:ABC transporter permease [Cryobacterium glaciale]TFB75870.1 ABC transporter permease [Cryobacterium glaciale]